MGAAENKVEQYLVDEVEKREGLAIKVKRAGVKGVPDRIVILNFMTVFVECKSKQGKLEDHQIRLFNKMGAAGALIFVVNDRETVDNFIQFMMAADIPDEEPSRIIRLDS